ncbi:hypothetical protein [Methylobacterium sp. Leaf85]|uniref:hypothetical protein n=1 Tax=Methylobacterium sp. Leaf85 TaxID=1736241 RepID=UPI0006FE610B|nr:hypothetical protein [Methylobacterium sp. Leaf85]KQO43068.1 hypothetical protein ASF08_10860 [Methylobacterium sp. Leaf85]
MTYSIEVYRSPVESGCGDGGVHLALNEIRQLDGAPAPRSRLRDVDVPVFVEWMRERGHRVGWGWTDLRLGDDEALELRMRWL